MLLGTPISTGVVLFVSLSGMVSPDAGSACVEDVGSIPNMGIAKIIMIINAEKLENRMNL